MQGAFRSVRSAVPSMRSGSTQDGSLLLLQQPKATLDSYHEFWASMDDPDAANSFLSALVRTVEKSQRGTLDHALGVSNGSIMATMLLLVLYSPVTADGKELKKKLAFDAGKSKKLSAAAYKDPANEELSCAAVVSMIGSATRPEELRVMVERCANITVADGLSAPELADNGEIASSLIFGYLLRRLGEQSGLSPIISTARGILSLGPTLIPPSKALALLHMLKGILRACHAFTDEELIPVLKEVRAYQSWAHPVAAAAVDTLRTLTAELSMRGSSMYHVLLRECPWLLPSSSLVRAPAAHTALADSFVVHVVLDETVDWARAFRAVLMPPQSRAEEDNGTRLALCSMLYALLKGAGQTVAASKLTSLAIEQLIQLTAEACALCAELGSELEPKQTPVGALKALKESLDADGVATGGGGLGSGVKRQTEVGSDIRSPRLPPLVLRTLEARAPNAHAVELRTAAEQCDGRRYMFEPLLASLYERLKEGQAGGVGAPALRVCVAGGDGTLHKLVQAYVVLRCAFPRLLVSAEQMRVYLLPFGRAHQNRLAAFIASRDGWYRRHVFAPHFAGAPLVPHLILSNQSVGASGARQAWGDTIAAASAQTQRSGPAPPLPSAPLRACLNDYLRSATTSLPLRLFEVSCWLTPPAESARSSGSSGRSSMSKAVEPPFLTIAFAQSIELVGASGAAEPIASGAGLPIAVSYTMADPWGVPYPTASTITARLTALSMHTYAHEPFHSPSSGRLQMRCTVATKAAAASAARSSPSRHITSATISSGLDALGADGGQQAPRTPRGERFGLLVDGEYYGPFAHVQVGACFVPGSSEQLTLPIATFFRIGDDGTTDD